MATIVVDWHCIYLSWDRTSKNDENKNRVVKVQNSDESLISPEYGPACLPPMAQNKEPFIPVSFVTIVFWHQSSIAVQAPVVVFQIFLFTTTPSKNANKN